MRQVLSWTAVVALTLVLCAGSTQAGMVTYDFIEATGGIAGGVGAKLSFGTPPPLQNAFPTAFVNLDSTLGTTGPYGFLEFIVPFTSSADGSTLLRGYEFASSGSTHLDIIVGLLGLGSGQGVITNNDNGQVLATGVFQLEASVPEPSSLVMVGTAALAGLGMWSRRRARAAA